MQHSWVFTNRHSHLRIWSLGFYSFFKPMEPICGWLNIYIFLFLILKFTFNVFVGKSEHALQGFHEPAQWNSQMQEARSFKTASLLSQYMSVWRTWWLNVAYNKNQFNSSRTQEEHRWLIQFISTNATRYTLFRMLYHVTRCGLLPD